MIKKLSHQIFSSFLENRILNRWFILLIDMFIIFIATIISYSLSLQIYKNLGVIEHPDFGIFMSITLSVNLLFFILIKTYKGIIRYSTIYEFQRILISLFISDLLVFLVLYKLIGPSGSVALAYTCTLFMTSFIGLLSFRIAVVYSYQKLLQNYSSKPPIPVFLWGVNESNIALAQTLNNGKGIYRVRGFIGRDVKSNLKHTINLPILDVQDLKDITRYRIKGILFSGSTTIREEKFFVEKILDMNIRIYVTQQINIKNTDQLSEAIHHIRSIQIEDLLGRPQIEISMDIISDNIKDKVVLVTGAAGSIGSEIVRQLAHFSPARIICLDQAETPLNNLNLELEKSFPHLNFKTIMGDIKNENKISKVFDKFRPDIVYHAAAYKHVPMMEKDPCEAITTNVMGTKILVDLSVKYNVEMFVMISTDKAVNPTNVMGASKRIAEIYVQSKAIDIKQENPKTKFVTTRFGNVLGSNGSVIPLFREQIEKGGPITVTDPNIIRYFMTIPEACRLVLEASVIGDSGFIYVFDMGEPVKILDLANKMIDLAGLKAGRDIKIEYSGLRPGEKLYEELLAEAETSEKTSHEKVMKAKVREYTYHEIAPQINSIITHALNEEKYEMVSLMKEVVPEFISRNSEFEVLDKNYNDLVTA